MEKLRIKIESDGKFKTLVKDPDTGEVIPAVQKISWEVNAKDLVPKCTLELVLVESDLEIEADLSVLPMRYIDKIHSMNKKELITALKEEAAKRFLCERKLFKLANKQA